MVLITLTRTVVCSETLLLLVIVMPDGASLPSVALDAEMVVAAAGQITFSSPTLKQSLRESDAGRYAVIGHLLDSNILILVDIFLILGAPPDLGRGSKRCQEKA